MMGCVFPSSPVLPCCLARECARRPQLQPSSMFFLSPDETLAALTAAFLGGALFGRIVWRRQAYDASIRTAADALVRHAEEQFRLVHDSSPDCVALLHPVQGRDG